MLSILFFSLFFQNIQQRPQEINFDEVIKLVNEGKVEAIKINRNDLLIELIDKTKKASRKEPENGLIESFKNYGLSPEKYQNIKISITDDTPYIYIATTLISSILPVILIGLLIWFFARQAFRGQAQALGFGQANPRLANFPERNRVTFKDVAGLKEAKEELKEIVDFLKNPKKYLDIGAKIPRGVLLMGPPGSGKTLLARAVAGEANVPFFHISGSEFVEMFVGVGAARVRDLFQKAKKAAPAIIFIDEIDAVGRHRGAGLGGGHDEREQTLNQILVEMDGFEKDTNLILMAATNRPDVLDPALLRPGRFDRRIILDNPDINDRLEILKLHSKNKPLDDSVNLREIAERTPGFSGADIENLLNEAAILAARENRKKITQDDLMRSMEKVLLGLERKNRLLNEKEKKIAAYHEAGHALTAHLLPNTDPVRKISIISRGFAAGYTLKLPVEDRHFFSRSQFLDELVTLLGGYAAEKIVFNEVTTGASNDLERATKIAKDIVMRYGMSENLGPVVLGERDELIFLGREIATHRTYSEDIAARIDKEVESLLKDALAKAQEILNQNRQMLDKLASILIEKESIEREEFEALVGPKNITNK
jgi:cell division protease FtsH